MTTENPLIDRIRNLLAMADGQANEAESMSAMAMASKLMAKHGIEEADLKTPKKHTADLSEWLNLERPFHVTLAQAVALLFNTRVLTRTRGVQRRTKEFVFAGRPENIEASELTMSWVMLQLESLYKAALPKGMDRKERARFRKTFKEACAFRILDRCHEMIDQQEEELAKSSGTALVIHRNQLSTEIDELFSTMDIRQGRQRKVTLNHAQAAAAGHHAGNQVKLRGEVE